MKKIIKQAGELREYTEFLVKIKNAHSKIRKLLDMQSQMLSREVKMQIFSCKEEIKNILRDVSCSKKLRPRDKRYFYSRIEQEMFLIDCISNKEDYAHEKSILENLYYFTIIFTASLAIFSFLGYVLLFVNLHALKLGQYFFIIASDIKGLFLFSGFGLLFFVFFYFLPYFLFLSYSFKNQTDKPYLNTFGKYFERFIIYASAWLLAFYGFLYLTNSSFTNESVYYSFVLSFIWMLIVLFFDFYISNYRKITRVNQKINTLFFFMILWVLVIPAGNLALPFINIEDKVDIGLRRSFSVIGFSKKDYSWYKISKLYYEKMNFNQYEIDKIIGKFKHPVHAGKLEGSEVTYLFGRLEVDTLNIQILCSITDSEDERYCHRFAPWDLIEVPMLMEDKANSNQEVTSESEK